MQKIIIIILLFNYSWAFGQEAIKAKLIVLNPAKRIASKEIAEELKMNTRDEHVPKNVSRKIKQQNKKQFEFLSKTDFFSDVAKNSGAYLTLMLGLKFGPEFSVIPVYDTCSGEKKKLMKLGEKYGVEWIVNYPIVELSKVDGKKYIKVTVQLFNSKSQKIELLEKELFNDANSKKQECQEDTWDCTALNMEIVTMNEIIEMIKE